VLVIDDHAHTRTALVTLFAFHGYEVASADAARSGLASILRGGIDVVITDWKLGDDTGGAMLQKAIVAGALADVGVVIFSASSEAAAPPSSDAVVVSKSLPFASLLEAVQTAARRPVRRLKRVSYG
jgi:DNA-binding NtrC family response regulator